METALVFLIRKLLMVAPGEVIYLNTAITDGRFTIGTRYCSDSEYKPLSLYVSEGSRYVCEDGVCHMLPAEPSEHAVLIVSEKLTDTHADFKKVPLNHFVIVDENSKVSFAPIQVRFPLSFDSRGRIYG